MQIDYLPMSSYLTASSFKVKVIVIPLEAVSPFVSSSNKKVCQSNIDMKVFVNCSTLCS